MPLIDILMADESDAPAIGNSTYRLETFPGIAAKHVDQVKLAKLALILDGLVPNTPALLEVIRTFTMLHESSDDGPWVYMIPDQLVAKLAGLDAERRTEVAKAWASNGDFIGAGWEGTAVKEFVDAISGLASGRKGSGVVVPGGIDSRPLFQ
jgi:hypothetical protein